MTTVDVRQLETKVQALYRQVAEQPHATYHFEVGRKVAERLGYPPAILDRIPSGMDAFVAAELVGPFGRVVGVDFTAEQLAKARRVAAAAGFTQVGFRHGHIESPPVENERFDCVISNGVINLSPDKPRVFTEAVHILRRGGRLAIADIVTEQQLKDSIVCDADLWASCIGGAAQQDSYRQAIEAAGLRIQVIRDNPYEFLSPRARNASATYGVKSISVLAIKP
jgi:arsenite methyltransferase